MIHYSETQRNNDLDEYKTPTALAEACVRLLLRHYNSSDPIYVLEPGANSGVWGRAVRETFPNSFIVGVEYMTVPEEFKLPYDVYIDGTDFLTWVSPYRFDVVLGNPPYSLRVSGKRKSVAEKFVRKGLALLEPDGYLYYLLRSGFRHSLERYWWDGKARTIPGLHQSHHYMETFACVSRPSFYKEDARTEQHGSNKTNAHEYDLMVWSNRWRYPYGYAKELDWNGD